MQYEMSEIRNEMSENIYGMSDISDGTSHISYEILGFSNCLRENQTEIHEIFFV